MGRSHNLCAKYRPVLPFGVLTLADRQLFLEVSISKYYFNRSDRPVNTMDRSLRPMTICFEYDPTYSILVQCMDYRDNLKCSGDIAHSFTVDAASYVSIKPVTEGYKRCGLRCLSEPDVVAFNWVHDTTFTCECLSSGQAQQNQKNVHTLVQF